MPIDGLCYYCKQMTNMTAGNPGLWPLRFAHPENPGMVEMHHTQCVINRLRDSPCKKCGCTDKVCASCGLAEALIEAADAVQDARDDWWTKALAEVDVRVLPVTGDNGKPQYTLDNQAHRHHEYLVAEMKRLGIEDRSTDDDYDTVLCNVRAEKAERALKDIDKLYQAEVQKNGKVHRTIEIEQEALNIGIDSLKAVSQSLDQSELWRDKMHTATSVALESLRLKPGGPGLVGIFQEAYRKAVEQMAGYDGDQVVKLRKDLPTPTGYDRLGQDVRVLESKMGLENFVEWIMQRWCKHFWRPAVTSRGPAKMCNHCSKVVQLTQEEFYAEFGRMPIL